MNRSRESLETSHIELGSSVRDVMSFPVITALPTDSYKHLVQLLAEKAISCLPIVEAEGRLCGIVSEADLLLKQPSRPYVISYWESPLHRREFQHKAEGLVAADIMTLHVHTATPEMSIPRAARLIRRFTVKHLPVVDVAGRVVGIVSRGDLLKPFLRDDDDIRNEVVSTVLPRWLFLDPHSIEVDVNEGIVSLHGSVERSSEREMISRFVSRLDGVVRVDNLLGYAFDDAHLKLRAIEAKLQ
jgi:CBS-domain-containing membrane protein